jgi:hypothetical protein
LNLAIASGVSVVGESAAFGRREVVRIHGAPRTAPAAPTSMRGASAMRRQAPDDERPERVRLPGTATASSAAVRSPTTSSTAVHQPVSFRLDPASGERTVVSNGLCAPLDPTGTFAVAWTAPSGHRSAVSRDDGRSRRLPDRPLAVGRNVIQHRASDPWGPGRDHRLRRPLGRDRLVAGDRIAGARIRRSAG